MGTNTSMVQIMRSDAECGDRQSRSKQIAAQSSEAAKIPTTNQGVCAAFSVVSCIKLILENSDLGRSLIPLEHRNSFRFDSQHPLWLGTMSSVGETLPSRDSIAWENVTARLALPCCNARLFKAHSQ